jgi:hypothetical protein
VRGFNFLAVAACLLAVGTFAEGEKKTKKKFSFSKEEKIERMHEELFENRAKNKQICQRCHDRRECKPPECLETPLPKRAKVVKKHSKNAGLKPGQKLYALHKRLLEAQDVSNADVCFKCHTDRKKRSAHYLGPEKCFTCHAFRPGKDSALFLRYNPKEDDLACLDCHDEKETLTHTKHDFETWSKELKDHAYQLFGFKRPIVIPCQLCHDIHGGKSEGNFLRKGLTGKGDENMTISACLNCHKNKKAKSIIQIKHFTHPMPIMFAQVTDDKSKESIRARFFTKSGKQALKQGEPFEVVCSTCHDPHKWSDKGSPKNKSGDINDSFLRQQNKVMKFCSSCHGPEIIKIFPKFHFADFRDRGHSTQERLEKGE